MAILVIWLLCGLVGWAIGNAKGRAGTGLALGMILGLIGVIIVACLSDQRQPNFAAMPPPVLNGPPPGWYADPSGKARYRWWDGYRWTGHVENRTWVSEVTPSYEQEPWRVTSEGTVS